MTSDPPPPGAGGPPGDDFEALAQRAAAAAARGAARQRDLDVDAPTASGSRARRAPTWAIVTLVVLVFAAGGAVGWIVRGGSTAEDAATPTPDAIVPTTSESGSQPSSTAPAASAPTATSPSTTAAPSTVSTTPPPSTETPPVTTAPPPDAAPPAAAPEPQMQHTVRSGESFWAIAETEVARVTQHQPALSLVDAYWRTLVRANAERLTHPGNADLLYPGQVLVLPPVPASP